MNRLTPPPANPVCFTIKEAGATYRFPQSVIRDLIRSGKLPAVKLPNGGVRLRRVDMDATVESLLVQDQQAEAAAIVDDIMKQPRQARLGKRSKAVNAS